MLSEDLSLAVTLLDDSLLYMQNDERLREATPRQQELLRHLAQFLVENDRFPKVRESMAALGLRSTAPVQALKEKLITKEMLIPGQGRGYVWPATGTPELWKLRNYLNAALRLINDGVFDDAPTLTAKLAEAGLCGNTSDPIPEPQHKSLIML